MSLATQQAVPPSELDTATDELMAYEVEDVEVDENATLETGCLSCS